MSSAFGKLFIDDDGDLCIEGREYNLVACPAIDDADNGFAILNPDIFPEIVRRWNATPAPEAKGEPVDQYVARICVGIPADCCDYGVVSLARGLEVCRVWREEDARQIASLLNAAALTPSPDTEHTARKEVMPDDEANDPSNARFDTSPGVTAGAVPPDAELDALVATETMVDAAFKALPPDAHGTIGSGEMYRVLEAALRARPVGEDAK